MRRVTKVLIMKKTKKAEMVTTFDRLMQNPDWRNGFEKGYEKFLISEFLIEAMEENNISVRKLAEKAVCHLQLFRISVQVKGLM